MAIDAKKLAEIFDIDPERLESMTEEQIIELRESKWIGRAVAHTDESIVNKATGKRIGSLETLIKQKLAEVGVEFEDGELTGKKLEEVLSLGTEKLSGSLKALKEKAAHGNDKKLQDLQAEFEKAKKQNTELVDMLKTANSAVEQTKTEAMQQIKSFKLNTKLTEAKSKLSYSESANEFTKVGFDTVFSSKYKVDLDDQDNIIVTDAAGNAIKNSAGTGFLGFEDVYKTEAQKAGLLKANNGGGAPPAGGTTPPKAPPTGQPAGNINPAALAMLERMKQGGQ